MLELIFESDNGGSVTFTGGSAKVPYLLTAWDGGHGLSANIMEFTQYLQHGSTYVASQLPPRDIIIRGKVQGDVVKNRIALLETMTPLAMGTLTLRRGNFVRQIRCVVEQAPSFAQNNGWMFSLSLRAPNPFWESEDEIKQDVAAWEPRFKWPLIIPIETGVVFGLRTVSSVINVFNSGDSEVGMHIRFSALGTVKTPAIIMVDDANRYIRADVEMKAGDRVEVSTERRNLYAKLISGGLVTNIFGEMDPFSELDMQLSQGDNLFRFDAEEGYDLLDVAVYYTLQYLGV